jgi:hypothetical protein
VRRLLAFALAACVLPCATASAHEGNPNYRSDVHGLAPAVPGVTLSVLNRDDRLQIVNRSDRTIVLEGYSGDPYARLQPDGTVQVNRNSAATYLNAERDGIVPVPPNAQRDLPPDWQTVSRTHRFEWHDHRMHWMGQGTPPAVKDASKLTKVDDWVVPVRVDGAPARITGTLWWTPPPGGGPPVGAIAGLAAIVVVGLGAVVVVRRRRRLPSETVGEAW